MTTTSKPAAFSFVFNAHVGTATQIADVLREEARAQTAAWPQYGGTYFDGWKLGRLTRDVKTKLGFAGSKGDLVLFRVDDLESGSVTFWSRSNAIATAVAAKFVVAA